MADLMNVCGQGHDLTLPYAYLYLGGGNRVCRICTVAAKGRRPQVSQRQTKAAFDG